MSESSQVRVTHRYQQPIERVFDAWLTPALASRFLFATRTGNVLHCDIDAVVGGGFLVTDRRPNADLDESFYDAQHRGKYLVIDRPSRIVFDFSVEPFATNSSRVTLDFVPLGASLCELVLTHDLGAGDVARANLDRTRHGWTRMLEQLDRVLGTRVWPFKAPGSA